MGSTRGRGSACLRTHGVIGQSAGRCGRRGCPLPGTGREEGAVGEAQRQGTGVSGRTQKGPGCLSRGRLGTVEGPWTDAGPGQGAFVGRIPSGSEGKKRWSRLQGKASVCARVSACVCACTCMCAHARACAVYAHTLLTCPVCPAGSRKVSTQRQTRWGDGQPGSTLTSFPLVSSLVAVTSSEQRKPWKVQSGGGWREEAGTPGPPETRSQPGRLRGWGSWPLGKLRGV